MSDITLPDLPNDGGKWRWRFMPYGYGKELRLEKKGLFFWSCYGSELLSTYNTPQGAVDNAASKCLAGRNWIVEQDERIKESEEREQARWRAEAFPSGVVKEKR